MARCGCSGSVCSCVVTGDGTTATVSGAGSAANPYVVSSLAATTVVEILDTPTLNLTITGDGSLANPYIISGVVAAPCLSTDAGNVLAVGTDGCLYSPATSGPAGPAGPAGTDGVAGAAGPAGADGVGGVTTVTDTATVDATISGAGTVASPYDISADVIVSPDAGNVLVAHANGLYAPPPGAAAATVIQGGNTNSVHDSVSGAGTVASPFIVTSNVQLDPAAGNQLTLSAAGLLVLDTDPAVTVAPDAATTNFQPTVTGGPAYLVGGNVIVDPDPTNQLVDGINGLLVPAAVAQPVTTACGLSGDGTAGNPLTVVTAAAVACPADSTAGSAIYCDPANNQLFGPAEKFHDRQFTTASFGSGQLTSFSAADGVTRTLAGFSSITIVNPSPCLDMNVVIRFGVGHGDFENGGNAPGAEARVELLPFFNSTGLVTDFVNNQGGHQIWGGTAFESDDTQGASSLRAGVIPAGGSARFDIGAQIKVDVYNGNAALLNYQTFIDVEAWSTP